MRKSSQKPKKAVRGLNSKGDTQYKRGEACLAAAQLGPSRAYLEMALKSYQSASDIPGTALCLLKLARAVELMGDYDRARETYRESLGLFSQLNDRLGAARCKAFLGNVAWAQGDYPGAKKLLLEAYRSFQEKKDVPGQAWVMDLMGNLNLAQGRDQDAEKCHRDAYAMARELGESPEGEAWNGYHLAAVELFRGHFMPAREGFLGALKIFKFLKDVLGEVAALTHLTEIACEQNDYATAEQYFLEAARLVIPTQCKPLLTDVLTSLARLLKGRGEDSKAIGLLMIAISHPTCRRQTKDRMASLLESLEAHFSKNEIESGFKWAKNFTLEQLASTWVSTLSNKSKAKKPSK